MQRNKKKYLQNKINSKNIKVVILCGGIGYRLKEETEFKPKPMVEIGGKPMLWHIMKIYDYFGFRDFVIALGYKGNIIKDYFVNKKYYDEDFTLNTKTNSINHINNEKIDREYFNITFADTGLESFTGERIRRLKKYLKGKYFMVTYGDGLADVNVNDLLKYHISSKALITVTAVNPTLKFGGFEVDNKGRAVKFEKRARLKRLINGGFMVFNRNVLDLIKPDSMIEDVFEQIIENGRLAVYRHEGFFHAMDTYQDMQDLNEMWKHNPAWKIWH